MKTLYLTVATFINCAPAPARQPEPPHEQHTVALASTANPKKPSKKHERGILKPENTPITTNDISQSLTGPLQLIPHESSISFKPKNWRLHRLAKAATQAGDGQNFQETAPEYFSPNSDASPSPHQRIPAISFYAPYCIFELSLATTPLSFKALRLQLRFLPAVPPLLKTYYGITFAGFLALPSEISMPSPLSILFADEKKLISLTWRYLPFSNNKPFACLQTQLPFNLVLDTAKEINIFVGIELRPQKDPGALALFHISSKVPTKEVFMMQESLFIETEGTPRLVQAPFPDGLAKNNSLLPHF